MLSVDERYGGMAIALSACADAVKASVRVALPGIITAYDETSQTVSVRPAIREQLNIDGQTRYEEVPLLIDVPVVMPRAGGYVLSFAPREGDECLVVFSDLCIDSWWQSGGVQNPFEMRRHDFSDGFAILGVWSQKNRPKLAAAGVCLQNDDGSAGVAVEGGCVRLFGHVSINGKEVV